MRNDTSRYARLTGLLCIALAGCSAHASFRAGGELSHSSGSSGAEQSSRARPPLASTTDVLTADNSTSGSKQSQPSHAPSAAPSAALPATAPVPPPPAHSEPAAPVAQASRGDRGHGHHEHAGPAHGPASDHNRGHGNDADRVDEDDPGRSKQGQDRKQSGDHDRGHGNDADRVDEDNPGKSKKKTK